MNKKILRDKGQFFTPPYLSSLMQDYVKNCFNILDPAYGKGDLLNGLQCKNKMGIDIDNQFFKENDIQLIHDDFFNLSLEKKFDGIICNPPYIKYNHIQQLKEYENFCKKMNVATDKKMNLYCYFIIKSFFHLKENGKAIFLVPVSWSESQYGKTLQLFLKNTKSVTDIIFFGNGNVFSDNLSTGCLILMDKSIPKDKVNIHFCNKIYQDLNECLFSSDVIHKNMTWDKLLDSKWSNFSENNYSYFFKDFFNVKRGITTGNNDFFILNEKIIEKFKLQNYVSPCISSVKQIKNNETKWILNKKIPESHPYIQYGKEKNIDKGYITSHRKIWYQVENQKIAPIWFSVFYKEKPQFILNKDNIQTLTSFHCIYPKENFDLQKTIEILNSDFFIDCVQKNRRQCGNDLFKLEPNDLKNVNIPYFDFKY